MLLSLRVLQISPGHDFSTTWGRDWVVSSIIVRMTVNIAGGAWHPKNPAHSVVPNTNFFALYWPHWSFKGGTKAPISVNVLAKPADIRWGFVDWSFNAQRGCPFKNSTPNWKNWEPSLSHNSGSFSTLFSTTWDIETTTRLQSQSRLLYETKTGKQLPVRILWEVTLAAVVHSQRRLGSGYWESG